MKTPMLIAAILVAIAMLTAGFVLSGVYNIGADVPHAALTVRIIDTLRERSIRSHEKGVLVPKLDDPALIAEGAEHYRAMCVDCHLAPGSEESEIRPGLYPVPPVLAKRQLPNPTRDFWIIKHGIKMSAMPAWGTTHDDAAIWGMVAFLQKLPTLTVAEFQKLTMQTDQNAEEMQEPQQDGDADHGGDHHHH